MEKFTINVEISNYKTLSMVMEPGKGVMSVAKALSLQFKCQVAVCMFARNRRVYNNGEVISSNPDVDQFFDNITSQEKHSWLCFGQVTD